MKGKRHTPDQIIVKLREADATLGTGATIGQVCQKPAITDDGLCEASPWPWALLAFACS